MSALEDDIDIHFLFTDIDMPGDIDGLMLSARAREGWPLIGIVVTSGMKKLADDEVPSGAIFLSKPYLSEAVVEAFEVLIAA
jgi:CheY-like chemotaxis protein